MMADILKRLYSTPTEIVDLVLDYLWPSDVAALLEVGNFPPQLLTKKLSSTRDEGGNTILHYMAKRPRAAWMDQVISTSRDMNAINRKRMTPLHYAAEYGRADTIQLLADAGAAQLTFYQAAVAHGSALHLAAKHGHVHAMRVLIDMGAAINAREPARNHNPLHYAAIYGHADAVDLLLDAGAKLGHQSDTGTEVQLAAGSRHTDALRALLRRGADPSTVNHLGQTALASAISWQNFAHVKALVEAGFDLSLGDRQGQLAIHDAADHGRARMYDVVQLAEARRLPNEVRNASQRGSNAIFTEILAYLIESGADPSAPTNHGLTPLHYASLRGNPESVQSLLGKSVDVSAKEANGAQPIHWATSAGNIEVVELLLAANADAAAASAFGNPYDIAKSKEHHALMWLLRDGRTNCC